MSQPTKTAAMFLGAAGLCAAAMAGHRFGAAASPDMMLARTYNTAAADADVSWSATPPNVWLSGLTTSGQPLGRELQVGDVITIAGKGGQPEAIKVTALDRIAGERVGLPGVRFQLVTGNAHSVGTSPARKIRFLFSTTPSDGQDLQATTDRVL